MRTIRSLVATLLCLAGLLALPSLPGPAEAQEPEGFLAEVAQLAAGDSHSCARLLSGQVRCWGENFSGQLGDGSQDDHPLPTTVLRPDGGGPLTGVRHVDLGTQTACALLTDRQVRCWGDNWYGNLGDGTVDDRLLPVAVTVPGGGPLTGVRQVRASDGYACALLVDRRVRCWGQNEDGNLGDGTTVERHRAVLVRRPGGAPLRNVLQLTTGRDHACAVVKGGQAVCWGDNDEGAIGDGTKGNDRLRPRTVRNGNGSGPLRRVRQLAAGDDVTCARLADGEARCWGFNEHGSLGRGVLGGGRTLPVPVRAETGPGRLQGVLALTSESGHHVCVHLVRDQVRCWGRNDDAQLGDGTTGTDRPRPTVVLDPTGTIPLTGVRQVAAGVIHTCARLASGQVRCWGDNGSGRLGDGTTGGDKPLPVVVQL